MLVSARYAPLIIKDYKYWTLLLHAKQLPYIGRCYAWWKDRTPHEGEKLPLSAIPVDALIELHHKIFQDVCDACEKLGYETNPYGDRFLLNMCYLANEGRLHNHHMHAHFIPRSRDSIVLQPIGVSVHDYAWGMNYAKPSGGEHTLGPAKLEFIRKSMAGAIAEGAL